MYSFTDSRTNFFAILYNILEVSVDVRLLLAVTMQLGLWMTTKENRVRTHDEARKERFHFEVDRFRFSLFAGIGITAPIPCNFIHNLIITVEKRDSNGGNTNRSGV
jgi:hypothetical protein